MLEKMFLLAPPPQGAGDDGPNLLVSFLPFVLMFVIFYFFMIRPQRKKQKEREELLNNIQKGDKIVTIGGAHGKVSGIDNEKKLVWVQFSDNVKILFDKSSIASVEKGTSSSSEVNDKPPTPSDN